MAASDAPAAYVAMVRGLSGMFAEGQGLKFWYYARVLMLCGGGRSGRSASRAWVYGRVRLGLFHVMVVREELSCRYLDKRKSEGR
jgi:hypothetical protein